MQMIFEQLFLPVNVFVYAIVFLSSIWFLASSTNEPATRFDGIRLKSFLRTLRSSQFVLANALILPLVTACFSAIFVMLHYGADILPQTILFGSYLAVVVMYATMRLQLSMLKVTGGLVCIAIAIVMFYTGAGQLRGASLVFASIVSGFLLCLISHSFYLSRKMELDKK